MVRVSAAWLSCAAYVLLAFANENEAMPMMKILSKLPKMPNMPTMPSVSGIINRANVQAFSAIRPGIQNASRRTITAASSIGSGLPSFGAGMSAIKTGSSRVAQSAASLSIPRSLNFKMPTFNMKEALKPAFKVVGKNGLGINAGTKAITNGASASTSAAAAIRPKLSLNKLPSGSKATTLGIVTSAAALTQDKGKAPLNKSNSLVTPPPSGHSDNKSFSFNSVSTLSSASSSPKLSTKRGQPDLPNLDLSNIASSSKATSSKIMTPPLNSSPRSTSVNTPFGSNVRRPSESASGFFDQSAPNSPPLTPGNNQAFFTAPTTPLSASAQTPFSDKDRSRSFGSFMGMSNNNNAQTPGLSRSIDQSVMLNNEGFQQGVIAGNGHVANALQTNGRLEFAGQAMGTAADFVSKSMDTFMNVRAANEKAKSDERMTKDIVNGQINVVRMNTEANNEARDQNHQREQLRFNVEKERIKAEKELALHAQEMQREIVRHQLTQGTAGNADAANPMAGMNDMPDMNSMDMSTGMDDLPGADLTSKTSKTKASNANAMLDAASDDSGTQLATSKLSDKAAAKEKTRLSASLEDVDATTAEPATGVKDRLKGLFDKGSKRKAGAADAANTTSQPAKKAAKINSSGKKMDDNDAMDMTADAPSSQLEAMG